MLADGTPAAEAVAPGAASGPPAAAAGPTLPAVGLAELGRLMPLFVWLDPDCRLRAVGPTLRKLTGRRLAGLPLTDVFALWHPRSVASAADLARVAPVRLSLLGPVPTSLRGVAVPLGGAGVLLNLSFGSGLRAAVRDHGLSHSDFAETDLAFELLYLTEANAAIMAEASKFSERLRGARAEAQEQALTDPLTGLRNRRGLDRALERLAAAERAFGLVHVDLDHFKQINDTLGHAAGDRVLQVVAARLRGAVRDADGVARIGGDEFVVLLPDLHSLDQLGPVAQRLLRLLAEPVALDRVGGCGPDRVSISASLGAVVKDGSRQIDIDRLLMEADRALYRSKDAGRGRVSLASGSG